MMPTADFGSPEWKELRALDIRIAQHLGWTELDHPVEWWGRPPDTPRNVRAPIPHFSSGISAAWPLAEQLLDDGRWVGRTWEGKWCVAYKDYDDMEYISQAGTAPLAICLAYIAVYLP